MYVYIYICIYIHIHIHIYIYLQGRCVGINMQKLHFIQQEALRYGNRVYRIDIDFKNALNAMSQAAL